MTMFLREKSGLQVYTDVCELIGEEENDDEMGLKCIQRKKTLARWRAGGTTGRIRRSLASDSHHDRGRVLRTRQIVD